MSAWMRYQMFGFSSTYAPSNAHQTQGGGLPCSASLGKIGFRKPARPALLEGRELDQYVVGRAHVLFGGQQANLRSPLNDTARSGVARRTRRLLDPGERLEAC